MSWMGPTVREVRSAPHLHARHPARPPPPSAAEVPPRALPEPVPTACAPQVSCAARPVRRRAAAEHDHDVKPPSSTTSATRGWLARRGRPSAGLRGPAAAPWACTGEALRPAALARHAACLVRARCRSRDAQARACEVWVWGSRSSGRAASPGAGSRGASGGARRAVAMADGDGDGNLHTPPPTGEAALYGRSACTGGMPPLVASLLTVTHILPTSVLVVVAEAFRGYGNC